jgi:hypothetical protein
MSNLSQEELKKVEPIILYENIDNFLDSAQKLDITSKNATNLQGTYTMREPLNFVRYVEAILGEINSRM